MPIVNATRHILASTRKLASPGEGGKFWIGQVMVIISTILGVYLAANAGFERAIEFDAMVNKRSTYYLINSLESELTDNIAIVNKLIAEVQDGPVDISYQVRRNQQSRFIWKAMQETDNTFQVPAIIITGIRRYYQSMDVLIEEVETHKIPIKYFTTRATEEHKKLKEVILPAVLSEKEKLIKQMKMLDISLEDTRSME